MRSATEDEEQQALKSTDIKAMVVVHSEFRKLMNPKVLLLALVFCSGQLMQELIAEAVFTQFEIPQRPAIELAIVYAWFQQVGTVIVALCSLCFQTSSSTAVPVATREPRYSTWRTWSAMFLLSALIFASTVLPNIALKYVQFPAKVVSKSSKLVPTMVVSVVMGNSKRFSIVDYLAALLLISGAIIFALSSSTQQPSTTTVAPQQFAYLGLILLGTSALADALVPNIQQVLMKTGRASAQVLAIKVNMIGSACIFLVLFTWAALEPWVEILIQRPIVLALMMASGLALGIAVLAYTMLIKEAGSVVAVAVATARKVLTLTLSYAVFPGKTFGARHAGAAMLVAFGMALGPLWERACNRKT